MSIEPKFTVSGYRGVWNDTLTKEIAQKYAYLIMGHQE